MRTACIDVGSNTTRLLVADREGRRLVEVHQERDFTQLARKVAATGAIGPARLAEVVALVEAQVAAARAHGAARVRIVATAAVRNASDGALFAAAVQSRTGLTVEILSGEREARLAFGGVAGMLDEHDPAVAAPLGVVDVGGGSCELVVGDPPDGVRWWASVGLGSGSVTEAWLTSDPPGPAELESARERISAALAGLRPPRP
ncbi:MAG: hypothetical protein ACRDL5_01175, partial [Solirubrobacteraceae bacterium]